MHVASLTSLVAKPKPLSSRRQSSRQRRRVTLVSASLLTRSDEVIERVSGLLRCESPQL
jgi:hypothetical protein